MRKFVFRMWSYSENKFLYFALGDKGLVTLPYSALNFGPIQQLIGKSDRNGVDIFEGDYIKYYIKVCELGDPEEGVGEVFYDEDSACFLFDRSCEWDFIRASLHCQVVGNIYERPTNLQKPV